RLDQVPVVGARERVHHRRDRTSSRSGEQTQGSDMTTLGTRILPLRSRLALLVAACFMSLAFAAFGATRASALTTAANCALPGSNFQGGDGNQAMPSAAEETFCNENLLPTSRDWQSLAGVINSPDPQTNDS